MIDDIEADIAELGLLEDDEILLDEAALLLGLADHPDADIDDARAEIDAMTARIEALGGLGGPSRLQAERLAHTIAHRCGLRGAVRLPAPAPGRPAYLTLYPLAAQT